MEREKEKLLVKKRKVQLEQSRQTSLECLQMEMEYNEFIIRTKKCVNVFVYINCSYIFSSVSFKFTWGSSGALCIICTIISYHLIISVNFISCNV